MSATVTLSEAVFEQILPFHVVWNAEGEVARISPALRRLWSLAPEAVAEVRLERPFASAMAVELFPELTDMMLSVGCPSAPGRLVRGELLELPGGRWLLCALPPISRVSDLQAAGLKLSDLPLHAGLGDALIAAEATQIALEETRVSLAETEKLNASLLAMNDAFGRFVPRPFLEALGIQSPLDATLGARASAQTSVMFADLRNFTTLSEQMGPEDIFAFINRYLSHVAPRIRENEGFVVHYLGDGILALFSGSPELAVRAAVEMQEALKSALKLGTLGADLPEGTRVSLGIGLHFGLIEMGIVGESGRWDSSVISDAVNTASRVEGLTKVFGVEILISGELSGRMNTVGSILTRRLGWMEVKGRVQRIEIYEVLDSLPEEVVAARRANLATFADALAALEDGAFDIAAEGFAACIARDPADRPARYYLGLCRN